MAQYRFLATICIGFALLCTVPQAGQAQERWAVFIHGFSFGDSRPDDVKEGRMCNPRGNLYESDPPFYKSDCNEVWRNTGARWEASGTPARWRNGPLDGSIKLKYFDRDLYHNAGGISRDKTLDRTRKDMMERFVRKMKKNAPNAEWVLVGHSQGGIVARLLHEHIRRHAPGLNVEGILAIASPMQGGKPSTVSYGARSGYTNVKPVIDGFLKDILTGPLGDASGTLLNFILPGGGLLFDIVANVWDLNKYIEDGVISVAEDKLRGLNEMAVYKDAEEAIGPNGELIQKINRVQNPDSYRALLGAERAPVPARVASGRRIKEEKVVTFGPTGAFVIDVWEETSRPNFELFEIFKGSEKVVPGEEPVTVDFFDEVQDAYVNAADYYRYRCYGTLGISCLAGDYRKWKRWKQGRRAIQNFGSTYSEIINAYRLDRRRRTTFKCHDDLGLGTGQRVDTRNSFSPPSAAEYVHSNVDLSECVEVVETVYVSIPNKTDGLLGTATTTWNPPTGTGREENPNLGPHSILYNDRSSGNQYKRGGTGYNHAEMVYNERRYSASEDPGISDGAFSEGQRNPPMRNAEEWLEDVLEGR